MTVQGFYLKELPKEILGLVLNVRIHNIICYPETHKTLDLGLILAATSKIIVFMALSCVESKLDKQLYRIPQYVQRKQYMAELRRHLPICASMKTVRI